MLGPVLLQQDQRPGPMTELMYMSNNYAWCSAQLGAGVQILTFKPREEIEPQEPAGAMRGAGNNMSGATNGSAPVDPRGTPVAA